MQGMHACMLYATQSVAANECSACATLQHATRKCSAAQPASGLTLRVGPLHRNGCELAQHLNGAVPRDEGRRRQHLVRGGQALLVALPAGEVRVSCW